MELVYEGDDYNLYTVPIKLNGEDSYLSVAYDYEAKDFYILGATSGVDESGQAGKDMRPLKKGDKVSIVYYAQSLEGDDEIQEMPDEFYIFIGDTVTAVLFADTCTDCYAAFHGSKALKSVVVDNGK